jgi:tetratricopeptide (TPR) repeat protein
MQDYAWVYVSHGLAAWSLGRMGKYTEAMEEFVKQEPFSAQLGGSIVLSDWFAAARAEISLAMGNVEQAIELANSTVDLARKIGGVYAEGLAERVWGQALARLDSVQREEAEAHLNASLIAFEQEDAQLEAARTRVALGEVFQQRRNFRAARDCWSQSAARFADAGLKQDAKNVHVLLTQLSP